MPRKKPADDQTPRRRRGAAAVAQPERGLALRILLHSPKDMAAGLIAFSACGAIVANALLLQSGPHPAPIFGSAFTAATEPKHAEPKLSAPRLLDPRPVDGKPEEQKAADPRPVDPRLADQRLADQRLADQRLADQKLADQRPTDPLANLVKATSLAPLPPSNVPRPPMPIPAPIPIAGSRRVAAVQRALTAYGYGQLKPTGNIGPDTKVAIEKFERERKMPVTGQVSDRLVHELGAAIGRPVE